MAKTKSIKKNDILNAVEMMDAKPVTHVSEVINDETGSTETVTMEIAPSEVHDATGVTTIAKPKTTQVEVEPGVFVELALGRPVNPDSARQKKLQAQQQRAAQNGGTAKLGRPSVPGSANAIKKAEMEAKKSDPTYVAKRGRPVIEGSARQQSLMGKDEKLKARARAIAIERGLITVATDEILDHASALVGEDA